MRGTFSTGCEGRRFDSRDQADSLPVALASRRFASCFLGDAPPIGRRLRLGGTLASNGEPMTVEVIGVVGDLRSVALHEAPRPAVWLVHPQVPTGAHAFVARTSGDPAALLPQLRRAIGEVHSTIPVALSTTMDELVATSVRQRRFVLVLLGGFAALALALAAAGVFGLMAFTAAQRTKEYGIRRALGADRAGLMALVLRRGLLLGGAGILFGAGAAALATRVMEGLLFEVTPLDLRVFALAAAGLAAVVAAATLVPALRAARVRPIEVLRSE